MTGLELLQEEMLKRGAQKQQIQSKILPMVLDILSEDKTRYLDIVKAQNELAHLEQRVRWQNMTLENAKEELSSLKEEINGLKREKAKYLTKERQYVNDWLEALKDMETAEGRDLMRKAQVFVNSVDIDTKYDNTAFIIGLASLLSGGEIGAIDELKKINKKLPTPDNDFIRVL